jgi:D-alanyl-D-alanine carboxypeptidase
MTRAILACLAAAAILSSAAAARPQPSALQADVDALVAAGAPGVVLLVRDGGRTTRLTGGMSELATSTPMQADVHYRIASLTKSYVAAVVLQLVGERRLRLNDSVERWLPGVVPNGANITIRQLLNHTSGLQDHERDPVVLAPYFAGDFGYYWAPERLVAIATSHDPRFPPGDTDVASYSSTNYVIAGLIVERVTGRDIGVELKRRIFQPLHLSDTSYPTSETQLPSPFAHGYFLLGAPPLVDLSAFSPSLSGAAGAIVSTVDDVAAFYRGLLSGRVLKDAQLATMKKTLPSPGADLGQRMGYGLERFPASCGPAWGHSGSFPGYWGHAWSSGDGKRQAVLMVNIDPSAVEPAATAAFYKLLDAAYCSTRG